MQGTTTLPPSCLDNIRESTRTALRIPPEDVMAVDYMVSLIVSNTWTDDADPLWGWLIGPPGSWKTELLRPQEDHPKIVFLSSLTNHALVSGYDGDGDGQDMSLLPKLANKILTIKDFTAVLSLNPPEIKQIFGDLRDIYDGSYSKAFGNVGMRKYKVKMGLIAAVTPAIDAETSHHVVLGERFLAFRVCRHGFRDHGGRIDFLRHVAGAMSGKSTWRATLKSTWWTNLDGIFANLPSQVSVTQSLQDKIIYCADILARTRNLPSLRGAAGGLPEYAIPVVSEVASRLVNQLSNLALARCAADGRTILTNSDLDLVRRVTVDTIPPTAWKIVSAMFRHGGWLHVGELSKATKLPVKTLMPILHNWEDHSQGLVESRDAASKVGYIAPRNAEWRLSDATTTEITDAGLIP